MSITRSIIFIPILLSLIACHSSKGITSSDDELYEIVILDTLEVENNNNSISTSNELDIYHEAAKRSVDLIHTKLEVSFDWENEYLIGKAYLTLEPYFYATSQVVLDAKGFEIISIKNHSSKQKLEYLYDGSKIIITLEKSYFKNEKIELFIDYIAKPNEAPIGGSAAITSDKGLFFINASGKDLEKPQQIWTQGETEASSKWFPTVDKPNERCTQEIYITVQDKFKTLSNGLLLNSQKNNDGTRTDYWKMDLPHAPYLFMMTVGEFAKVDDQWNGIDLSYYVEPSYESSAKKIFNHTPEMLTFFSEITGVNYPWQKYAQIVVRDYVSGAMENTTAVIFGEFVQQTNKELEEHNNDMIVAHEMFHHWFGDYVTCESWSNIVLNEGFANYAEYLWMEEKYGRKAADKHKADEMFDYIMMMRNGGHDLINYAYEKKEDMFDTHSYNKGGMILHMLRDYVGDDAFFSSLKKYLTDNAFSAVEAHELRMAFEDTTGEDLNWFFDQWFFDQGHPMIEITKEYLPEQKTYRLDIKQTQDINTAPAIYRLPVKLDFIYSDGRIVEEHIWINKRNQSFEFDHINPDIVTVLFDNNDVLLMEKSEEQTDQELYYKFLYSDNYITKTNALSNIKNTTQLSEIIDIALVDDYHGIRTAGLNQFYKIPSKDTKILVDLSSSDKNSYVRSLALEVINESNPTLAQSVANSILEKEQSYQVILTALNIIGDSNPSLILKKAEELQHEQASSIKTRIADVFGSFGDMSHIEFFKNNISTATKYSIFPIFNQFQKLLLRQEDQDMISVNNYFIEVSKDQNNNPIKRFLSTKTLSKIKTELEHRNLKETTEKRNAFIADISLVIETIKSLETNEKIKMMYKGL